MERHSFHKWSLAVRSSDSQFGEVIIPNDVADL